MYTIYLYIYIYWYVYYIYLYIYIYIYIHMFTSYIYIHMSFLHTIFKYVYIYIYILILIYLFTRKPCVSPSAETAKNGVCSNRFSYFSSAENEQKRQQLEHKHPNFHAVHDRQCSFYPCPAIFSREEKKVKSVASLTCQHLEKKVKSVASLTCSHLEKKVKSVTSFNVTKHCAATQNGRSQIHRWQQVKMHIFQFENRKNRVSPSRETNFARDEWKFEWRRDTGFAGIFLYFYPHRNFRARMGEHMSAIEVV